MTGRTAKRILTLAIAAGVLHAAPAASADVSGVFGGAIGCADQGDADSHVRFCGGGDTTVPTWDGTTPIDVNVALPPAPVAGADGPYPLLMVFHGWGGSEWSYSDMKPWAEAGYAVFSMSDRGWGSSCGGMDPKRLTAACAKGYNHLMDTRYEVRDAQHFAGRLVDEGIAIPDKIGAHGGSYGGGISMALAALRNRVMMPGGELVAWRSPAGVPMEIAAAQPDIPWTDLGYSLAPNGHSLDYAADAPYFKRGRIGVLKQSFVAGLFATGQLASNYAPPGADPDADLNTWYALLNAGEPYDQNPLAADIVDEVTTHHSSYYIDDSVAPAPLLISNGWTDDLFPPDEAIRFYNRTRTRHPGADISLLFSDHGHQRGQNKAADTALRRARTRAWFAHYLKGESPAPDLGVEVLTQTCPEDAPSGGPYTAPSWAEIAPGEIRHTDATAKTIAPAVGSPEAGRAYDPIAGPGACATASGADEQSAASYRLDPAPAGGFTLLGSPTVVADINSPGPTSQIAARLVDVAPGGDATLVARGLYRPEINVGAAPTRQVFQLHPNGYRFEPGHVAKLELLPNDLPYGKASTGQLPITVSNLELRLPVLESPGTGPVSDPAAKVLPSGYELAADFLGGPPPVSVGGDADLDGIPDSQDACPGAKGPVSSSGCPASAPGAGPAASVKPKCAKRKKKRAAKQAGAKKRKRCAGKKKKRR